MRHLKESFFERLMKEQMLLDAIQEDDTLDLEFRENRVDIYYRGGVVFSVSEGAKPVYKFNDKYKDAKLKYPFPDDDSTDPFLRLPYYKNSIDRWFYKRHKKDDSGGEGRTKQPYEREFSQIIARENNSQRMGNSTDYFILDMEYESDGAKPDLIAVNIERSERKNKTIETKEHPLSFIEVKYGTGAYTGTAGIEKHIDDYITFKNKSDFMEEVSEDMRIVYRQKKKMGLLPGLNNKGDEIRITKEKPELILALIGRNTNEEILIPLLKKCWKKHRKEDLEDIYIAQTSELGFGLYKDKMIQLEKYLNGNNNQTS